MRVLCIADSLALPRPKVHYEQTWIFQLKSYFKEFDFITLFKRELTTKALITDWEEINAPGSDMLEFYSPDWVIIQLGIVDCAPRYLNESSIFFLFQKALPPNLKFIFWKWIKYFRKRKIKNARVNTIQFKENFENYFLRCKKNGVKMILLIKICTPSKEMTFKNPIILESIRKYNRIIDDFVLEYDFVRATDPLCDGKSVNFVDDGYHPNEIGNKLIFESIKKEVMQG